MLQLTNTMTRRKEAFEPKSGRAVKMFSCGPSIYRRPHVGNYRTFIWQDALQKYLEYLGYDVSRVLNFTDIEDKAIEEAEKNGKTVAEITESVADRYFMEARALGVKVPDNVPRSSTSVDQAVRLILELVEKDYAYWHGGDVFFDPLKFEGFGKLFRLDMSRWPKEKRRFRRDTYPGQRWNLGDFILWHGHREGDTVFWDTPIGKGRPSWNIQDPAMISQTLGFSLDIFCGGIDNIYRHHDYNIAVMESVSGEELARYWVHGEHVLVGGKKMSKSLDNIVYPEDLTAGGCTWAHIRHYLLSRHYRRRLNLSMESFRESCGRLDDTRSMAADILGAPGGASPAKERPSADGKIGGDVAVTAEKLTNELSSRFEAAMNDDLDTQKALDSLSEILAGLHGIWKAGHLDSGRIAEIESRLRRIDGVLGVLFDQPASGK